MQMFKAQISKSFLRFSILGFDIVYDLEIRI